MNNIRTTSYDIEQLLENEKGWLYYDAAFKAWKNILRNIIGYNVLDIGCGSGIMMMLNKLFNPDLNIHGFEGDPGAKLLWQKRGLEVETGNIYNLPYDDDKFETVYSSHVLEHLENPREAIIEMKRIASKRIINIVPDGDVSDKNHGSPHLHIFNRISIEMLHHDINLNIIDNYSIQDYHMNQIIIICEK